MTVNNTSGVDYIDPAMMCAQDYYAFGMMIPGRTYSAPGGGYRYGFNGKEKDDEIKGSGKSYAFEARIFDPRLGRVDRTISPNVKKNINIYQTKASRVDSKGDKNTAVYPTKTEVQNNDFTGRYSGTPGQPDYQVVEHGTIDDISENRVVKEVVSELEK